MNLKGLHVHIGEPEDLRKQILECSTGVVKTLLQLEKLKEIRSSKIEAMTKAKHQLEDLEHDVNQLKKYLPEGDIPRAPTSPKKQKSRKKKKKTTKAKPESKESAEVRMLEEQLAKLEKQLREL